METNYSASFGCHMHNASIYSAVSPRHVGKKKDKLTCACGRKRSGRWSMQYMIKAFKEVSLCQCLCAHGGSEIGRCYSMFHVLFSRSFLSGFRFLSAARSPFSPPTPPPLLPPGSLVVFIRPPVLFVCLWRLRPLIRSRSNPVVW